MALRNFKNEVGEKNVKPLFVKREMGLIDRAL